MRPAMRTSRSARATSASASWASSAVIKNSNGDTHVADAAGELRIKTANGSIAVDRAHAGVVAKTANGDVRLGEVARGTAVLETERR